LDSDACVLPRLGQGAEGRSDSALEILRAAIHDFDENGYSGASIGEIAKRAGTSKSLVTYYFPTKPALASAILNEAYFGGVFMGVEREADDPLEAIMDAVRHMAECVAHGSHARVALKLCEAPELQHAKLSVVYHGWFARIGDYLDEARRTARLPKETDPEAESRLLVAGMVGVTTLAMQTGDFSSLVTDTLTITRQRIDLLRRARPFEADGRDPAILGTATHDSVAARG
jgi:TetR/AcrR family transcriptional repressor of nem operon